MSGILHTRKLNHHISFKPSAPNIKQRHVPFFPMVFNKSESFFYYLVIDIYELHIYEN